MSVKRYSVWEDEMFEEKHAINSNNGMVHLMVKHEDYAALEARCAALAAENAGLKEACGGDGSYKDCPACAHSEYIEAPDTTATDDFLAEVRAQGVEMLREHPAIKLCSLTHVCDEFAAQIRKGVQS